MIVNFVQTRSGFNENTYEYIYNNNIIHTAYFDRSLKDGLKFILKKDDKDIITLSCKDVKLFGNLFKSKAESKFNLYNIYNEYEKNIGEVCRKSAKGKHTYYYYYECKYNNKVYTFYDVGFGNDGRYICIYFDNTQVSLIEKDLIVHNNNDTYKLYIISEEHAFVTYIMSLYYDCIVHGNYGKKSYKSKSKSILKTIKPELKDRFDPDFKNYC